MTEAELTAFVKLVREMREAQTLYVNSGGRSLGALKASVKLEAKVDAIIKRLSQRQERGLFSESEETK